MGPDAAGQAPRGGHVSDEWSRIDRIARLMIERRPVTILTGAGVSTASGIPDFRSPHGLWSRYPIEEYATIQSFRRDPEKVWVMLWELAALIRRAQPNPAQEAMAAMEHMGVVDSVVTQNIDGLHQKAGSKRVIELHGSINRLLCLNGCGKWSTHEVLGDRLEGPPPRCPQCGSVLKPDVTFFGEEVAQGPLYAAFHQARYCGAMLVAGTSAVVAPASLLPGIAANLGAVIVEANRERTDLTPKAHYHIPGPNEVTLPILARALRRHLSTAASTDENTTKDDHKRTMGSSDTQDSS